jgi:hypothetical protein
MTRGLSRSLLAASVAALLVSHASAWGPATESPAILQRFLALDDPTPTQFKALRHLEARNEKFEKSADGRVDRRRCVRFYHVVCEGLRLHQVEGVSRLARPSARCGPREVDEGRAHAATSLRDRGAQPDGLASLTVKPRRKGVLLVDGSIFLNPDDGEL